MVNLADLPNAGALSGSETLPMQQGSGACKVTALRLVNEILAAMGVYVDESGRLGIGTSTPGGRLGVNGAIHIAAASVIGSGNGYLGNTSSAGNGYFMPWDPTGYTVISNNWGGGGIVFRTAAGESGRFSGSGNLLVGTSSNAGGYRCLISTASGAAQSIIVGGIEVMAVNAAPGANASTGVANPAAAIAYFGRNNNTGRSINAGGTINASGADYAEYVLKAWYCSVLNPGAICGINADGLLTDRFDDAHTFVIKSTNPAYVGNDTWAQAVGPRPEQPALDLPAYTGPERPGDDDPDYEAKLSAWEAAQESHAAAVEAARAAHAVAMQAYQQELADFEERLEAERIKWDRIAFSGQVPVNHTGAEPGQYLIPTRLPDGAIGCIAKHIGDMTLAEYAKSIGQVWKILPDGRAWVAVKVA